MFPLSKLHRVVASVSLGLGLAFLANGLFAPRVLAVDPTFVDSGQRLGQESSTSVALGDLNGDGSLDAFVGNMQGQADQVWLNDGHGQFALMQQTFRPDADTRAVALGDFNGDGALDVFIVTGSGQPDQVWFNDGKGNFTDSGQHLGSASGTAVVLADFDGNGTLDAFVANRSNSASGSATLDELWLNDGKGNFTKSTDALLLDQLRSSRAAAAGDVDGNGKIELLTANAQGYGIQQWHGNDQTLLTNVGTLADDAAGFGLGLADFNGDGRLDVFIAGVLDVTGTQPVDNMVWLNNGSGGFGDPQRIAPPRDDKLDLATAVAVGDVDGDGRIDAFVATSSGNDQLWLNTSDAKMGDLSFKMESIGSTGDTTAVALGDLNGDGSLDAFIANGQNEPNRVLFNTHSPQFLPNPPFATVAAQDAALADLNGDGRLDIVTVDSTQGTHIYCSNPDGTFTFNSLPITATTTIGARNPISTTTGQIVALGDLNGDGKIDIYIGGGKNGRDHVWFNQGGCNSFVYNDNSKGYIFWPNEKRVALGDLNGDGAVDAFLVNGSAPRVLLNDAAGNLSKKDPSTPYAGWAKSVALGDVNGDGALDAVVADAGSTSWVYLNNGDGTFRQAAQRDSISDPRAVALGDLNGDGTLDAVFAGGTPSRPGRVFFNNGSGVFTDSQQSLGSDRCYSVALADLNGDGALDAVLGCAQGYTIWWNDGKGNLRSNGSTAAQIGGSAAQTVLTGDVNGDGYPDIVTVNSHPARSTAGSSAAQQPVSVWLNSSAPSHVLSLAMQPPGTTPALPWGATAEQLDRLALPITYTLTGTLASQVKSLELSYSLDGGGQWQPAAVAGGAAPVAGQPGTLVWDTAASNLFGASDNVMLRLAARFQPTPAITGTYSYTGAVANPTLWPQIATVTTPFRVRGTQVRVVDEAGQPIPGAVVFRRSGTENPVAAVMADSSGQPFITDNNGYLRGRGALQAGDELAALAPMSSTYAFTQWAMSALPSPQGLDFYSVPKPTAAASGVQTLTVTSKNPLLLFDLDIALEWDASNDGDFLNRLKTAIGRTSAVLFQVTNGQVALGNVTVHLAKQNWSDANVVIYAANNIHPRATMGGVVLHPVDDISGTQVITAAYIPGQIRMGALWDPFGQNQTDLQQDWWRAFAHELSHYFLFQSDDYLGVRNGVLTSTDCKGSIMTNAYDQQSYGQFLTRDQWVGDCLDTVAYKLLTGRTDWETITHFLPMLKAPVAASDRISPGVLPLAVTQVTVLTNTTPGQLPTLPARPYDLRDETGSLATLRQATGYLYQTGALFDDINSPMQGIIALGSTGSGRDSMMVRGARQGDYVCVFDTQHDPPRLGCTQVRGDNPTVQVQLLSGWSPQIDVTAITSSTLAITVTQAVTEGTLRAQVIPAYGLDGPGVSVAVAMTNANSTDPNVWTGVAQLTEPSFEGFVRVWQPSVKLGPPRESATQYFLSAGWGSNVQAAGASNAQAFGPNTRIGGVDARAFGPNTRIGGVDTRAFGPNTRIGGVDARALGPNTRIGGVDARALGPNTRIGGVDARSFGPNTRIGGADVRAFGANRRTMEAPVASGDGRVTIFDLEDPLRTVDPIALQSVDTLPHLPSWLTPVGKGYRLSSTEGYTRTIAFHYVQRDVPEGYEYALGIYFLPAGATSWAPLHTQVDMVDNMASAQMPQSSAGTYALVATVPMPALHPGWNFLAYTIPETRTVQTALDSVSNAYTVLYSYDPEATPAWRMYDAQLARNNPTAASVVNTLDNLEFGHSYLLYATSVVTPYLAVPGPHPAQTQPQLPASATAVAPVAIAAAKSAPGALLDVAPATFYGYVTGSGASAPSVGQEIVAEIGGTECGRAALISQSDGLFYAMQVAASAQTPGCGSDGASVQFTVGRTPIGQATWHNTQANQADLVVK